MTEATSSIRAIVTHARHVPAAERTALALHARGALDGHGLLLETCHRVEGFAAGAAGVEALGTISVPAGATELRGEAAIRHAISVAVGRDSVVVGEDQILHQVRQTFETARARGLDPALERLFSFALRAGRVARSWRQGPERSLATVALAAVEHAAGRVDGRRVLIVGAGRMGRLAARAAAVACARVVIANRTAPRAEVLAREVGGEVVALDPGPAIAGTAGVIVALAGPWPLSDATAHALTAAAAPVIDLSVPPAVPPELATALGDSLVTADDLAQFDTSSNRIDDRSAARFDALIDRTTAEFMAWLDGGKRRATASALTTRAERARAVELSALWRRLPELDPEARAAIDAMTRHLAEQLLREPLEQLGHDTDGAAERAVREAFAL